MARKRMIDPSFWEDPTIGTLSIPARLLFIGMMSHADDEGRIEVEPRYIRRAVFGFDEDITAGLVACYLTEIRELCRSVQFYEVDGRALAAFINWKRYQYIQKPQASRLPAPPELNTTVPVPDEYVTDSVPLPPNRIEKNRTETNRNEDGVESRLQSIFENPGQVKTIIAAAAKRGGFTLSDVDLCEAWLKANAFEKNVGTLYNILKAGKLPVMSRTNGHQPVSPQPKITMDEINRQSAALIASDHEAAALVAEIRSGRI